MPLTLGIHKFRFPIGAPVAPVTCLSTTYINSHENCKFIGCGPDAKQLTEHQYADEEEQTPPRKAYKGGLRPTQPKCPPPAHLLKVSSKVKPHYADEEEKDPPRKENKRRLEPTEPSDPPPVHLRKDSFKQESTHPKNVQAAPSQHAVFKWAQPPPPTERAACKLQPPSGKRPQYL